MAQDLHATDDQGFPLNPYCCEACLARSRAANAEYLRQVLAYTLTPGDLEPEEWTKP